MNHSTNSRVMQLAKEGLWTENPGLVKLLGLCPLLAVSNTLINGLALGLASLLTLLVSNTLVASCRSLIPSAIRIPLYVLIIASTVSVIELLMQAYLPGLFVTLGIFLPLIVTNCLILGRAEAFSVRHSVGLSFVDAVSMGSGFLAVLVVLGGVRELIGQGSLFADSAFIFGELASQWPIQLFNEQHGLLLAILPPGAFIGLGLLLAIKNKLDQRLATGIHYSRAIANANNSTSTSTSSNISSSSSSTNHGSSNRAENSTGKITSNSNSNSNSNKPGLNESTQ